jgi:hypothetical protein
MVEVMPCDHKVRSQLWLVLFSGTYTFKALSCHVRIWPPKGPYRGEHVERPPLIRYKTVVGGMDRKDRFKNKKEVGVIVLVTTCTWR